MSIPSNVGGYDLPDWATKAIAGALVVFGLTIATFGFRLFKITLFVVGFFLGALAVGIPIAEHVDSPSAPWIGVGVGSFVGLVLGGLAAAFSKAGVFLVGAGGGVATGIVLNTVVGYKIPINHNLTLGVLAAGCGLAFGILALILRRPLIIVGTSVLGCFAATFGIGNLIPPPNDLGDIIDIAKVIDGASNSVPGKVYGYIGGFAIGSLLAIFFQSAFTAGKAPKKGEKDQWAVLTEDELNGRFDRSGSSGGSKGKDKKDKKDKKKDKKDGKKDKDAPASSSTGAGGKMKASERLRQALLNDYSSSGGAGAGGPPLPPPLPFSPGVGMESSSSSSSSKAASTSIWARPNNNASKAASNSNTAGASNPFKMGGLFGGGASSSSAAAAAAAAASSAGLSESYDNDGGAAIQITGSSYGAGSRGGGGLGMGDIGAESYTGDHGHFYGSSYGGAAAGSPATYGVSGSGGAYAIPDTNPWGGSATAASGAAYYPAPTAPAPSNGAADWNGPSQPQKKKGWFGR